ncbi:hypothetical protein ACFO3K_20355 [Cellulomonas algicola]|uniref:zinc finger domain-containing protein n=1 Tax=Cellulomonas algicola TaxID=2071633 RepID=UPI00135AE6E7|nr:hypothetical protein [Cellulomonas algicola]
MSDVVQDEAVTCPRCGAAPGEPCRTADRVQRPPHRRRTLAAQEASRASDD